LVDEGVCQAQAARLNRAFVTTKTLGRPLVIFKAAAGLDARVAVRAGTRTAVSSREANLKSQVLRASVDAVAVGSETLLVDDPVLTVRDCHRLRPLVRVVFDRRLRTPPSARLLSTIAEGPVIIVTDSRSGTAPARLALEAAGAAVIAVDSLQQGVDALVNWDVATLLVEGGPQLQAAFVRAGLVDRVHLIVAPRALGPEGVSWLDAETLPSSMLTVVGAETRGVDTWIEADVHRDR
jgi:diaminohydroxyphosphoribosylaminopyrimidine deaminase/5-amino-6-(5-phosphoribosylamino)uracil reductase